MTTVYDIPPNHLIEAVAAELKKSKKVKPPEWAPFVKTGVHTEKSPVDRDWWYTRLAA
ncbi:MAG: 40S ribosomal protein S19, partial [Thermoplasmata archaeon]